MLVMVECVCVDDDVAALDMLAEQWTQDLRFRRVMPNAETTDARSVVMDGSLYALADALRLAAEKLT